MLLPVVGLAVLTAPAVGHDEGDPTTTVTVTPSGPYGANQPVTVTGSGFPANTFLRVDQCNLDRSACVTRVSNVQANGSGGFSTTVAVTSSFTGTSAVNCRQVGCILEAVTNNGSSSAHAHLSFRLPAATTGSATNVSASGARLEGQITPSGEATSGFAEYSTSETLATSTSTPAQSMGTSGSAVSFAADVGGLAASTTYYFRVVATWSDGTVARGQIASFTTGSVGTPSPPAPGGGGAGTGTGTGATPDTIVPVVSLPVVSPRTWAVRWLGPREVAVRSVARGTTFRYTLSERARVLFTVHRLLPGRRVGRLCRAPTRLNRGRARCTRYVFIGRFAQAGVAGRNRKPFSGKIGRRALRPGRYRATLVATDAARNRSRAARVAFTVVRG
ncbi:MAG TPA: neocarzinostatin apoprotein domain-containing protein [Solirubrobacteraceae bacterium]|nr:neocarzinostatin apoprotein domain-containing protein [Solirubrobacteraceae bacterium]